MAEIDPEVEWAKLLAGVQRELAWIMILVLFPLAKTATCRKEATASRDVTYLLLRKQTLAVDYAGETIRPPGRFYGHKMFESFGEDFIILLFNCRSYLPEVVRKGLEAILKILFLPNYSDDMDKAHMTKKRIAIVRLLLQYWIMENCDDLFFKILNERLPLFQVDVSQSEQLAQVQNKLLIHYKYWRLHSGHGKKPAAFGTLGE